MCHAVDLFPVDYSWPVCCYADKSQTQSATAMFIRRDFVREAPERGRTCSPANKYCLEWFGR